MTSKLASLIEESKALKAKIGSVIKDSFAEFFSSHPEVKSVKWDQYSRYFNDGDACPFRVREFFLKLDEGAVADDVRKVLETGQAGDDEGDIAVLLSVSPDPEVRNYHDYARKAGVQYRPFTSAESALVEDFGNLQKACQEVEDVMESMFGNHVEVTATKDGFSVAECDHD